MFSVCSIKIFGNKSNTCPIIQRNTEGAFLHDIGHLVGMESSLDQMIVEGVHLGIEDHDRVGEEFLAAVGFPESVTKFVRGHVLAKRYLVFKFVPSSHFPSRNTGVPLVKDTFLLSRNYKCKYLTIV